MTDRTLAILLILELAILWTTSAHGAPPLVQRDTDRIIVTGFADEAFFAQRGRSKDAAVRSVAALAIRHYPEVGQYILPAGPPYLPLDEHIAALRAEGIFAEPDHLLAPAAVPDDPLYALQWHSDHLNAPDAWERSTGAGVVIAVVDTGVDVAHPDLQAHFVPGYDVVAGLAQADGGDVSDVYGHGTKVLGTAGAIGNNGEGLAGLAYDAGLMPVRATALPSGSAYMSDLAAGARWAAEHGARAICVSYEGVSSSVVQSTGAYVRGFGAQLVWAAGNYDLDLFHFDHEDVVIVGGTKPDDGRAYNSNYGRAIDLVAPSINIKTTENGGWYTSASGTSFAAPLVAGAFGLVWSVNPSLAPSQVEAILARTAVDLGPPGEDDEYGHGRIDAGAAVRAAACRADVTGAGGGPDGFVGFGDLLQVISAWGACGSESCLEDVTGDGLVGAEDLFEVLSAWGTCR